LTCPSRCIPPETSIASSGSGILMNSMVYFICWLCCVSAVVCMGGLSFCVIAEGINLYIRSLQYVHMCMRIVCRAWLRLDHVQHLCAPVPEHYVSGTAVIGSYASLDHWKLDHVPLDHVQYLSGCSSFVILMHPNRHVTASVAPCICCIMHMLFAICTRMR